MCSYITRVLVSVIIGVHVYVFHLDPHTVKDPLMLFSVTSDNFHPLIADIVILKHVRALIHCYWLEDGESRVQNKQW